jgi:pimeloyl-ACP methyl ester carboxylesterase
VAYVALYAIVGASYRALLFPAPRTVIEPALSGAELFRIPAEHGEVVALHASARAGEPTIVYFHGNGEDLADTVMLGRELHDAGVGFCAVEYPGYGLARGQEPSEATLYVAAESVLAELERRGVPADSLVLVGQSLGSGVATELAARGHGAGLALLAPFTSIPAVARRFAPFLPIDLLIRDRFDNLAKAPRVTLPTLVVHGDRDELVPFDMGRALSELFPNAELYTIEGAGHSDLYVKDPGLVRRLTSFARASIAERAKLDAPSARRARELAAANEATQQVGAPKAPSEPSRHGKN